MALKNLTSSIKVNSEQAPNTESDETAEGNEKPKQSFKEKVQRNFYSFIVFGILSFGISVYLSAHDDTEFYIRNLEDIMLKISKITDYDLLVSKLTDLSELSATNTSLRKLLANEKYINQLLDIILEYSELEINNKSAKTIENASEYITDYSVLPKLLEVAQLKYIPSYVKKTLATAICKIALRDDEARLKLASLGAIEFLDELVNSSDKYIKTQLFRTTLLSICSTCERIPTTITSLKPDREVLVKKYAKEEQENQGSAFELKKRELIQSGYHLYLHTSFGGFIWGCFESMRNNLPLRAILLNGCKNSIITAALPIIFVGLMTTYANEKIKTIDTTKGKFEFYFAGLYSLFPWYYILPAIERFSPYWIGGHVLGFMSFFSYLAYSKYDIFKSDTILIEKDRLLPTREVLIQNINREENKK
ncbi:hypothetical protein DICPUDRAFT_41770 [Dictyostelium purpureum]|uniref:Armadillo repeat-containing domain-containing protein n=1 Tax=Dictyostelium purpureum TaxID=5786 RepID=F1A0S4_DICPU|nr:uncharacterized protein DICPUDRAFT_41770 [Dictyostelium purpureum]EGC30200.1 hypothetical protein DICPUDRAFT_41770 [Dictyostelium purpureum]|eukprot:XP_003293263.1 hypothetical protein DICPUDRAFT_41770 [Dictyostelium purpureum]